MIQQTYMCVNYMYVEYILYYMIYITLTYNTKYISLSICYSPFKPQHY